MPSQQPNIMIAVGTRPEAIKMAPVISALRKNKSVNTLLCSTGQHREMLDQVFSLFDLKPDYDLSVMAPAQTLTHTATSILSKLESLFEEVKPDRIVVHGDTLTTFATSLAGFFHCIPVAHVEAGLRTGRMDAPWPEEGNRKLTSVLTDLHFAPTQGARSNLLKEGIEDSKIFVTGNTVVDALLATSLKIDADKSMQAVFRSKFNFLDSTKKLILVTGHRRENFGDGFINLCEALSRLAQRNDVQIVYPVHLNPNVQEPVRTRLASYANIHLLDPLEYLPFVYLMKRSFLILTDSGGIQEEAPSLGKPVLVMRDVTERPEAVQAGTVKLVGMSQDRIVKESTALLDDSKAYSAMSTAANPYGDGFAAQTIADILVNSCLRK